MNKKKKVFYRSLRWTMFWYVLFFIVLSALLALVLYTLMKYILSLFNAALPPDSYTLWIPIIALAISAILGTVLSVLISRWYLEPLSRLMKATQAVANGDFSVRVEPKKARREVAEYIRSFNKMAEELGSLEILRTDFVNTFSHEFKTPIISIRGFSRLLQSDSLTAEQRKTYTDTIIRETERLADMSTHALLLTQYEHTEIVTGKKNYSLDEQLRSCIRLQERFWLAKDITVEGELDNTVFYGSEELVEHIWDNLISNAIRFTPPGGQITVLLRQEPGEVCVSISDSGIGMDENTVHHIFDKFYKADLSPQSSGNGLGLAIVQRVVQLCGGSVRVFSRLGEGSTFAVTLPNEVGKQT
ncbi:MAG: HAMP domain-containing histidine kinase [Clostridiales bacterium]|nr:HAMP domain-containing histidine kinase [Clostridiales bacterium]